MNLVTECVARRYADVKPDKDKWKTGDELSICVYFLIEVGVIHIRVRAEQSRDDSDAAGF